MNSTVTSQPVSSTHTVTMQPVHRGWMETPAGFANCPRGLECLTLIDQLLIKQQTGLLEAVVGFETEYDILNSVGQRVYFAEEDTGCLVRICFHQLRSFDIQIFDNHMVEVIHLHRPLRCSGCCFSGCCFCCLQELVVEAPPGQTIGYVREVYDPCHRLFVFNNAQDQTVLHVRANCCCVCPCIRPQFEIRGLDNTTQVGMITKHFGGLLRKVFRDADSFTVTFPLGLDVRMKATAIGGAFVFD